MALLLEGDGGTKGQIVVGWSVWWMHIEQGAVNCDAEG